MAWDDDKSTATDPDNPSASEQLTATEWDNHVADQKGHASRHKAGGSDELRLPDLRVTTSVSAAATTNGEDTVFVDPSATGGVTITLASADAAAGAAVTIQDVGGTASSNTITVDTEGTETYADGDAAKTITTDRAWLTVRWDGSNWVSDRYQQVDQLDATAVNTDDINTPQITDADDGTVYDVGDDLAGGGGTDKTTAYFHGGLGQ
jgi:hypothetical protein